MRRFPALSVVVLAAVACTVVVWAVPAGQAGASLESVAPLPVPAPPSTVAAPELSSEVSVAPISSDTTPAAFAVATVVPATAAPEVDGPPAHLLDDSLDTSAPIASVAIVTTTTAAPTTTTAAPQATVAFTASQQYGSCSEDVPYDIFSGTATPGSTVTVSSPYGSGRTTADGSGHWMRTVEFPSAPRGETFAVTAAGLGGSSTLSFTATGSPAHS